MKKFISISNKNRLIESTGVFVFFFLFFLFFFSAAGGALCPDSFYHTKMAQLIWEEKSIVSNFPWMQYSTISGENFVGQHLLFHFLASPFVWLKNFTGMEVFISLINASFFLVFWLILGKFKVKNKLLLIILLLFSITFLYRLLLLRAIGLSLIFAFLFLYFLSQKKYLYAFLISFVFMWSYNAFFIVLIIGFCFLITEKVKKKKWNFNYLTWSSLGIAAGAIINPYFPQNISFFYQQIFIIPLLNGVSSVGAGAEWYPLTAQSFIKNNFLLWIIFSLILFVIINSGKTIFKKLKTETMATLFLSVIFLLLTIRSNRFIEYWTPFTVLAGALFSRDLNFFANAKNWLKLYWLKSKRLILFPASALIILIAFLFGLSLTKNYNYLKNANPYNRFENSANWLSENTKEKSVVYNVSWDNFPELFYWNDKNYYIIGLDPRFLYKYDKSLHEKYTAIHAGEIENPSEIIKNDFNSTIVFADNKNKKFLEVAEKDQNLKKAYQDNWATIYRVIE